MAVKKSEFSSKSFFIGLAMGFVVLVSAAGGALADRIFGIRPLDYLFPRQESASLSENRQVVKEESVVIEVVENVSPSVVTVAVETPQRRVFEFNPFGGGFRSRLKGGGDQDIGSGFVVGEGLVVTNKHVVSKDVSYKVITQDGEEHVVVEISRDPGNDIAILRVEGIDGVDALTLGDSSNLKVGQFVIAIGTALGEFRHSVTTGVISGLGRGITAGSSFEGFVEKLDGVIQTDAAINPGNSGGPLLDSAGEVIGVNVAVAAGAENIGFAIPINVVKDGLAQFESTGKFVSKPFLGVQYQMISAASAILNDVPRGAFVVDVVSGSPADSAGIKSEDIITKLGGKEVGEDADLADLISEKTAGEDVELEIWRKGETLIVTTTLSEFSQ